MDIKKSSAAEDRDYYAAWYKNFFGPPENTSYTAWTDNISDVSFYYHLGKTKIEITFESEDKIEVTLDEFCSQSKMKEKMEEKFRLTPPMLTPSDYEMVIYLTVTGGFKREK